MQRTLPILILSALPAFALAHGDETGGHDMHDMAGMSHEQHGGAAGQPGDPTKVTRTIDITMDDSMRFTPDRIEVKAGETVRFFVKNTGRMPHEMVIGTMDELKEHAEMMRRMPNMQHHDPGMLRLEPGQRGGIVWQFTQPGTVDFACLMPGHLEAGMKGAVTVQP